MKGAFCKPGNAYSDRIHLSVEHMTLQQLKAFLAVVECGGFRAASRHLNISQAGLTTSLKALEAALGVHLLRRSVQGVVLTAEGERLLPRAKLITREAHKAEEDAQHALNAQAGSLAIGFGPTPTAVLLHLVVPEFHRRFPEVQLRLFSGFYEQLLPELQQARIQLAITAVPDHGVAAGFEVRRLFRSALVVIARRDHPLAQARTLKALQGQEWVLLGPPGGPGGTVLRYHAEQGFPMPRVAATCESFLHLTPLLRGTDWLAMVPSVMMENHLLGDDVVALSIDQAPPTFDNCLIYRTDNLLTGVADTFAGMCQSFSRVLARGTSDTVIGQPSYEPR
jgi:DNA-binding transcriptional LysR family regulator